MIADEVNMKRETVRLLPTEELGQDGAQESHTVTALCAVECSF